MRNKLPLLERALAELDVAPEQTMYVGDSLQDEQCFRHVAHPVLSFWTRPEERERFRDGCEAFCPASQDDFRRYLDSLLPAF